jgi:hypothetical protein
MANHKGSNADSLLRLRFDDSSKQKHDTLVLFARFLARQAAEADYNLLLKDTNFGYSHESEEGGFYD